MGFLLLRFNTHSLLCTNIHKRSFVNHSRELLGCAWHPWGLYATPRLSYLEREQEHPRPQEVAEACAFLGTDGLRAPNVRDSTQSNPIVFCEQPTVVDKRVVKNHGSVDLSAE